MLGLFLGCCCSIGHGGTLPGDGWKESTSEEQKVGRALGIHFTRGE
jgi:hypothetical protein